MQKLQSLKILKKKVTEILLIIFMIKKGAKYFDYYMENRDKTLQTIGGLEYGEDGKTLKTAEIYGEESIKEKNFRVLKNFVQN